MRTMRTQLGDLPQHPWTTRPIEPRFEGTIKPHYGDNSVKHKQRVMKVLKDLAANLNNQVWLVTSKEVSELETTYGKIPVLNLAGKKGAELSTSNNLKLELPDISNTKQLLNLKAKEVEISSKMRESVQEAIKNNQILEDFEVEFRDHGDKFELDLQHKVYSNMRLIPAMVLQKGAHDFVLSVGNMDIEEKIHKVLRTAGHHAIIVKEEESIFGKFAKYFQYPEEFDFKSGSMWRLIFFLRNLEVVSSHNQPSQK
ncbi:uncharacterized protein PGTG_17882 [Puccinia graminis f. sp. tritici CRL 75-36-700-3]|uniref:Uncharacterized protein n=1 Tax=Puccinia graminis f. sp. tritici (strain CRL 75-36-700-3 / race SCCL) TaxID=418459 RepID=E3L6H7_PUCGT|nr:uncharacterized protein PGTG_17882 [Puccinia graminis f. sp. tritici CRL 75-36-700-3]EFP92152.1 hypothetical protein PGTG_17882 [Puccinia graminis f. sp. tritici CRL 75-36-700-3]